MLLMSKALKEVIDRKEGGKMKTGETETRPRKRTRPRRRRRRRRQIKKTHHHRKLIEKKYNLKESQVIIHHVHLERKPTMHQGIPANRWGY